MRYLKLKFLVAPMLLLVSTFLHAQSEWENIDLKSFKWSTNPNVVTYSSSLEELVFWNNNAEIDANRYSDTYWSSQYITMKLNFRESRPWVISFTITNENNDPYHYDFETYDVNGKMRRHKGHVFWGFQINVDCESGSKTKGIYYRHNNDRPWISYKPDINKSDSWGWSQLYDDKFPRTIEIKFDGDRCIEIYDNGQKNTYGYFYDYTQVSSLTILGGPAAGIRVTDFNIKRQTLYAEAKEDYISGNIKYNRKEYWDSTIDYSKAIEKGYEDYEIYYRRAFAYYSVEFYNNAIEDFTKALSYKSTEDAYFYRGLAKLAKNDISGIEDLKKGGSQGQALVREFEMDNITNPSDNSSSSKYIASGTGFFIDPRGYIVTNHHVIEDASGIDVFVTKSGKTSTYKAKSVVIDKSNDLAIIKIIDNNFAKLAPVPYTIGSGTKDVGTSVFAMGYPQLSYLGEEIKVTDGIISSKTGYQGDITTYQISAPIQPGNSGGPLFDKNGLLVGVTNAGVSELDNVGYAIKVSYMNNLIEASPETIYTPTTNQLQGLSFTDKIKRISPYVVIIKIY